MDGGRVIVGGRLAMAAAAAAMMQMDRERFIVIDEPGAPNVEPPKVELGAGRRETYTRVRRRAPLGGRDYKPNGKREVARRLRQMQRSEA